MTGQPLDIQGGWISQPHIDHISLRQAHFWNIPQIAGALQPTVGRKGRFAVDSFIQPTTSGVFIPH